MELKNKIALAAGLLIFVGAGCNSRPAPAAPEQPPVQAVPATTAAPPAAAPESAPKESTAPAPAVKPAPRAPTPTPTPVSKPTAEAPPASASVSIVNFAFTPATLTVKKGTTVTWTNQDGPAHTATGDNGGPGSDLLPNGQSYSFTFSQAGTFPYHCTPHPFMKATVVVTE